VPEARSDQKPVVLASANDYRLTFKGYRPGAKVLRDLLARFHDRQIHMPGGLDAQRETEKRAAQKEVVGYILRKLGQIDEE
jgi:hypothetical protein